MPSFKQQREAHRRKSRLEARFNAELREQANEIFELKNRLMFAEQPFKAEISNLKVRIAELEEQIQTHNTNATHMLLWCPECHERHIDVDYANKKHHTHACQHCGHVWRPAIGFTVGVRFLPGFKDREEAAALIERLKNIRNSLAIVGHTNRPTEIIDELITLVKS